MTWPPSCSACGFPRMETMADGTNINLEAEIEDFKERCRTWFHTEVTADNAGRFRDLIALGLDLEKKVETRRKAEKQPHLDAGKAIDEAHRPLLETVTKGREHLKKMLGAFMQAEERKRREEAEAARRAADEAARAAEERPDPFAAFDAAKAQEKAKAAQETARAPVNVTSAEGTSRAAGLRSYWNVEVSDGAALVKHFATSPHMIEEARKLAAAQVRAAKGGDCGIPGIKIIEEKRVA